MLIGLIPSNGSRITDAGACFSYHGNVIKTNHCLKIDALSDSYSFSCHVTTHDTIKVPSLSDVIQTFGDFPQ
jgi:hypothetical protein